MSVLEIFNLHHTIIIISKVVYNAVKKNFWFGNDFDDFSLTSGTQITYTVFDCEQKVVWEQYAKWVYILFGSFTKQTPYITTPADSNGYKLVMKTSSWLTPDIQTLMADILCQITKML